MSAEIETEYLSSDELEARTGIPASTWRYWATLGEGPRSFKLGRRRKWLKADVDQWLAEQRDHPAAVTASEATEVADDIVSSLRHQMAGNPVAALTVFRHSRHGLHKHLAGAVNALAKIAAETPDADEFLSVIHEVIARD